MTGTAGWASPRLIREFGPDTPIRTATDPLTSDCPNQDAAQVWQHCDLYFPDLVKLFGRRGRRPAPAAHERDVLE